MRYYGYHRTSTIDQHLDRGIAEINSFCEKQGIKLARNIYTDQQTGKNFNRPRYTILKEEILEPGDVLIISELDRLGRNRKDTLNELRYFADNNIRVMILEIPTTLVDYTTMGDTMSGLILEAVNNMLIEMYAVFAQAEIEKKEKRQREGIAAKKARGDWDDYGRPRKLSKEEFAKAYKEVEEGRMRPFECMKNLGLKEATFYRYRKEYLKSINN